MSDRKVNLAGIAYRGANGQDLFAFRGEEVDVHGDDVERFDELNGSSEESDDGKPAGNASLEEWHAYALTQGADEADLEGKSRNDIRDQYK